MAGTMPRHPCIFCPKSCNCLSQTPAPVTSSDPVRSAGTRRAAVPVFMGRVSPVLDTCTQLFMMESHGKQETARKTIPMKSSSIFERAGEIQKLGIGAIICGAVSDSFYNLLREADIDLVCGITGDIDDVIDAYRNGTLEQPRFRMPGSE
jgi:predicted Fe-Mo cluster-binding NifX family protein